MKRPPWLTRDRLKRETKSGATILLGAGFATLGLKGFLLPSHLIDGGVTGLALLGKLGTGFPLWLGYVLLSLPLVALGVREIGGAFAVKTVGAVAGFALLLALVDVPTLTDDPLLVAAFGGFALGLGSGLAMRGGAVLDSAEILAVALSRRLGLSVGDALFALNLVVFGLAAALIPLEQVLYSVLVYYAAGRTVDFVTAGIEEYQAVHILSREPEAIRRALTVGLGRGVTMLQAERGYRPNAGTQAAPTPAQLAQPIALCIVTRLEMAQLKAIVRRIDPQAFLFVYPVKEAHGGVVKKRPLG